MRWFGLILVMVLLTGCATTETVLLVQSQKYVLVDIDPKYLRDCDVEPPPDKASYLAAGHDEREGMMTTTLLVQYQNTKACTADKRAIKVLISQYKKDIEDANLAEEKRIKELGVK